MPRGSSTRLKTGTCPLCGRHCALTFHHLIPKKLHRRERFKKQYTRLELNRGIDICRLCHNGIHKIYDEMKLAKEFPNLEAILADENLCRHFAWVGKQKIAALDR